MSEVQGDDRLEAQAPAEATPEGKPAPKKRATARRSEGTKSQSGAKAAAPKAAPEGEAPVEDVAVTGDGATNGATRVRTVPRLLELFRSEVVPTMIKEFEYGNVMQVPRLTKIVLNVGLGEALTNPKAMESTASDLTAISGQKPIVTRARKSIANFKLREGNPIGMCVTLRGYMMYHFMDRLVNTALPRIRDFRGVSSSSFDGRGNYSMGIREQIIFPEIDYGGIERIRGFQVTVTTTSRTDAEASRLLALLGMPFARPE
jgi:large subunit ribosomal protein L5